jgi:hypothetical protein
MPFLIVKVSSPDKNVGVAVVLHNLKQIFCDMFLSESLLLCTNCSEFVDRQCRHCLMACMYTDLQNVTWYSMS